ncbi:hypothetical protein TcWFU_003265 [Taenia crassiceps]|uniref:Uncharacterized protein n=1 Tax=Taenia crassiceps TaxID=6207 RepID=A0ABR4QCS9_9CEST
MSSQRGNVQRNRPQKYKNTVAFKNNRHDTSKKTASLNQLEMGGLCTRCKAKIEWKIRYKKYKALTKPRTCVRCGQRNVKRAYFSACESCIYTFSICGKCGMEVNTAPPLRALEEAQSLIAVQETLLRMTESKTNEPETWGPGGSDDPGDESQQ